MPRTLLIPKELLTYRNAPPGSLQRKSYDYFALPLRDYLHTYHTPSPHPHWDYLLEKFVHPLFNGTPFSDHLLDLQKIRPPFKPDPVVAQVEWERLKKLQRYPDDIAMFFAFLISVNFTRGLSIEDWTLLPHWRTPWDGQASNHYSIEELLQHSEGEHYLRDTLTELSLFRF